MSILGNSGIPSILTALNSPFNSDLIGIDLQTVNSRVAVALPHTPQNYAPKHPAYPLQERPCELQSMFLVSPKDMDRIYAL